MPPIARNAVLTLPRLTGDASRPGRGRGLLPQHDHDAGHRRSAAAWPICSRAYGVADAVNYDLAEVRDLDYYTGITFEGFAPGLGFSLVSGGRYDDLIGHFGPPQPAVGWALTLDRCCWPASCRACGGEEPVRTCCSRSQASGRLGLGRAGAARGRAG